MATSLVTIGTGRQISDGLRHDFACLSAVPKVAASLRFLNLELQFEMVGTLTLLYC